MKKTLPKLLALCLMLTLSVVANAEPIKIYLLKSSSSWDETALYAWNGSDEAFGAWPGKQAADTEAISGAEYYVWTLPERFTSINIIFNNNNKGAQTGNIEGITETRFYVLNGTDYTTIKNPLILANPTITYEANTVTVTAAEEGGEIHYTTDGTEPTPDSPVYNAPFGIAADCTVKALHIDGPAKSEVVSLDCVYVRPSSITVAAGIYYPAAAEKVEICTGDVPVALAEGEAVEGQPENLYLVGNIKDHVWATNYECKGERHGSSFVFANVEFDNGGGDCYFSFITALGNGNSDWATVNGSPRYGAQIKDEPLALNTVADIRKFTPGLPDDNEDRAGNAYSWKIAQGTYTIVINYATGKVVVTDMELPTFKEMTVGEDLPFKATAEGAKIFTAAAEGKYVTFREGETVSATMALDPEKAYVYTEGELKPVAVAEVYVENADNYAITDLTEVKKTEGCTARINGEDFDSFVFEPANNELVVLDWEADNGQGLTFSGNFKLVNAVEDVVVRARTPEGWNGMAYRLVSAIDETVVEEGVFSNFVGTYFELVVPKHLIHATIIISNTPAQASLLARASAESYTYPLEGKSMYFDNNGEHWGESEYNWGQTGIEGIEAADEPVEYFTLQGVRVANPEAGIYLRRQGASVAKVLVK